jgi:hypothetical protein
LLSGSSSLGYRDPEIARGQLERIADRLVSAIDHDLAATPEYPKRDVTLFPGCDFSSGRQRAQDDAGEQQCDETGHCASYYIA